MSLRYCYLSKHAAVHKLDCMPALVQQCALDNVESLHSLQKQALRMGSKGCSGSTYLPGKLVSEIQMHHKCRQQA